MGFYANIVKIVYIRYEKYRRKCNNMKLKIIFLFLSMASLVSCATEDAAQKCSQAGSPIRPLAQDHVELARTEGRVTCYTPSIIRGFGKRLIAAYEFGHLPKGQSLNAHIVTSDDGGKTWTERFVCAMTHGRLFKAGKSIYYLGHKGNLRVARSDDNGQTWSEVSNLTDPKTGKGWHQSACNVWVEKGKVWLVMEHRKYNEVRGWPVAELAPVVMCADENADLTKTENWKFSDEQCFVDWVPSTKENKFPWDYFGVPFFEQTYPKNHILIRGKKGKTATRAFNCMGFLETNIVRITDPDHYWYDPDGKTMHLLMRAHTGGTGYAGLMKCVEGEDGSLKLDFEKVPSGKKCMFLPFPGGQMRFHICYDKKTKLYWLLSTQSTNSMTPIEKMTLDRFDLPNNERQRLVLHFSKNLVDWCFAGLVAKVDSNKASRHYAAMDIDGDDLIILSRSGDENAISAHEGNMITFHRVKNFRDLVY